MCRQMKIVNILIILSSISVIYGHSIDGLNVELQSPSISVTSDIDGTYNEYVNGNTSIIEISTDCAGESLLGANCYKKRVVSDFASLIENNENSDQIWGNVAVDSTVIFNQVLIFSTNIPGHVPNVTYGVAIHRQIDGVLLRRLDERPATGRILEGGINNTFVRILVTGVADVGGYQILLQFYENQRTEPIPEKLAAEYGRINEESTRFWTKSYAHGVFPEGLANKTYEENVGRTISGIRLYDINNNQGLHRIIQGGVNHNFIEILLTGNGTGRNYEFRMEFFSTPGSGSIKYLSLLLLMITAAVHLVVK